MKKIQVPLISTLDALDLSSIGFLLETNAQRHFIDTINWQEYAYKPIVAFDIARSHTALYLRYFVKGNSLKAIHLDDNSPVHTDSCVEFFMKKEQDSHYYNFEFNCIGTCDAARRLSRHEKQALTPDQYKLIRRHASVERKMIVEQAGLHSWELTVAIPFEVMGIDPANLPEKVYANFYKCADDTANPHYLSWNPIEVEQPDFHRPEFFGELWFDPAER